MKKYIVLFSLAWQRALVYRTVNLVFLLLSLINIFLSIAVWTVAYQNPHFHSSATFISFITYFVLVILLNPLVQSYDGGVIAEEHIKYGELSLYLLKPFPYFIYVAILGIPWGILQIIMSIPAVALLLFFYRIPIHFQPTVAIVTVLLIIGARYLSTLLQIIFALFTFWIDDYHALGSLQEISMLLFSGIGIPIFFFPPLLKIISKALPFQYILYIPARFIQQTINSEEIFTGVVIFVFWLVVLTATTRFLWGQGLKKFTGEGI